MKQCQYNNWYLHFKLKSGHWFSTYVKFSYKLTILTLWYAHASLTHRSHETCSSAIYTPDRQNGHNIVTRSMCSNGFILMPLMKLKTLLLALKACFSPFAANALFLYFLKTSENNRQVFWCFRVGGRKRVHWEQMG